MSREYIIQTILDNLANAPIYTEPFPYTYTDHAFPSEIYKSMVDNFPIISKFRAYKHKESMVKGKSTRYVCHLHHGLTSLSTTQQVIWSIIVDAFKSVEMQKMLFKRFSIDDSVKVLDVDINLVRDLTGYTIGPHPDGIDKIITMQFYLPTDDSRPNLGTELYVKNEGHDPLFKMVKHLEYRPNFGYAFRVVSNSYHGVSRLQIKGESRNSLMIIYRSKYA